jgi:hypothetical protein
MFSARFTMSLRGTRRYFLRGLLLPLPAVAFACNGEDLSAPTTGALEIRTATSGAEVDPDGYLVQMDAEQPRAIEPSSTLRTGDVAPGTHSIRLVGIAPNCVLAGDNPRSVNIVVDETASVLFELTCSVTTGTLTVTTTTTGLSQDPDGYTIRIDGGARQPMAINAVFQIITVSGPHSVSLSGVAPNCRIDGKNPRKVVVSSGSNGRADFNIACSVPTGG